jgi:HlyD family secretion protein
MSRIFRQQALEHASAPEQMDQLMQVVRPKHWLALFICGGLVSAALVWGIVGRLPTTVGGRGVLIRPHKVVHVQASGAGRLVKLAVQASDPVKVGDILGTIEQAEIRHQLQEKRLSLQKRIAQDEAKSSLERHQTTFQLQQTDLEVRAFELRRRGLHKRLRDTQGKVPVLKQRLDNRQRLEILGLLPKISEERLQAEQDYLANQDMITHLQSELQQLESDLKRLKREAKQVALQHLEASTSRTNQIQELHTQIALLELKLAETSQIVSPYEGRILELTTQVGQLIGSGQRVASIEIAEPGDRLVGAIYFPVEDGKKIVPGMTIHIAPDTVQRQRFGSMLGIVKTVSAFPITKEGVQSVVGNAEVVDVLLSQGPAIEVVAGLTPDATTFSGYQWSSSTGPPLPITAGTTTTGRVVLEHRAPITYFLPMLREASGFY